MNANENHLAAHDCGIIPAGTITGKFPSVDLLCATCGCVHSHEDQGLRATGHGCLTVHFLTIDELNADTYPRS